MAGPIPLAESNFLVPNATFFVELAAFILLFGLLAKFVIPPINRAMTARQEAIREQFSELDDAKAEAHQAEEKYKAQLADARQAANKIREEAREQGNEIVADARDKAHEEAERIIENGRAAAARPSVSRPLLRCVPRWARWPPSSRAGSSGESLEDDERSTRVVDRFLTDLEAMQSAQDAAQQSAGTRAAGREPLMLRAASAEARDALADRLAQGLG